MEKIAFILQDHYIYWSSIFVLLGAGVSFFTFLALYIRKREDLVSGFTAVPVAAILGLLLARFVHWYCCADQYSGLIAAMTNLSAGGFALLGALGGCLAAALLTRAFRFHRSSLRMLDAMAPALCAGISVGRLACFFNSADRGPMLESFRSLPWAWPTVNAVSGETEYRLATFFLQAVIAAVLAMILITFRLTSRQKKDGDTTLLFLLCYGASQCLLDSTRYDALYFRSNGFVSVTQVFSAVGMVLAVVIFSVRLVKAKGFRPVYIALWGAMAAALGVAGYMEYYVQRHGNQALLAYSIMGAALALLVLLTLLCRVKAQIKRSP